jgi:hypothetical protein
VIEINKQSGKVRGIGVSREPGGHGNAGFLVNYLHHSGPVMGEFTQGCDLVPPVIGKSKVSVQD